MRTKKSNLGPMSAFGGFEPEGPPAELVAQLMKILRRVKEVYDAATDQVYEGGRWCTSIFIGTTDELTTLKEPVELTTE